MCAWTTSKQIGLAVHNYILANKVFPPGTICATAPVAPHDQYDVWGEAAKTEPGYHSTSFLLQIVPYIEMNGIYILWDWRYAVAHNFGTKSEPGRNHLPPSLGNGTAHLGETACARETMR